MKSKAAQSVPAGTTANLPQELASLVAQIAVLSGDASKDGLYVIQLKTPAYNHPPAEMVTVISGDFHVGTGDGFEQGKGMLVLWESHRGPYSSPISCEGRSLEVYDWDPSTMLMPSIRPTAFCKLTSMSGARSAEALEAKADTSSCGA